MTKDPTNDIDTYREYPLLTIPPVGTLLRVKCDCNMSAYNNDTGLLDVPVKAGDIGVVESHGAIIKGQPCLARVRMFRVGLLVAASLKSLNGYRWEEPIHDQANES